MIQRIAQFQKIHLLHTYRLVLDDFHSHENTIILVLDIRTIREISTSTELQHVQNTLASINNEAFLNLLIIILSQKFVTVTFIDLILENYIFWETIVLHIELHQDQSRDLRLHLEDLSNFCSEFLLKIPTNTLKTSQSWKTNLNLSCKPMRWL